MRRISIVDPVSSVEVCALILKKFEKAIVERGGEVMKKSLIVENDPSWAFILKKAHPGHFNCDIAPTIEMAERLLQTNSYDLVVADLMMDDSEPNPFNRFDHISRLFAAIGKNEGDGYSLLPVIVVTAYDFASGNLELLTSWPGRIYGWHHKKTFNGERFLRNIQEAIRIRGTFKKRRKSPSETWSLRELWDIVLGMGLPDQGALAGIVAALLSLAFFFGRLAP